MQEGEANGKPKVMHNKRQGQMRYPMGLKYAIAVFNVGSGNKVVKEKLQSKEKRLLGNDKIKTEVYM